MIKHTANTRFSNKKEIFLVTVVVPLIENPFDIMLDSSLERYLNIFKISTDRKFTPISLGL